MSYPAVRRWLVEHTSIEPSLLDGAGFESLIAERLRPHWGNEAAYVRSLATTPDEVDLLTGGIAVPETWLFRYPRSYDLLVERLTALRSIQLGFLRMVSIGCATGEEPYCMAMAALHAGWSPSEICVDAIDRHKGVLRRAAEGVYGAFSVRADLPAWALSYLARSGESVTVDPDVRSLVRFSLLDALHAGPLLGEACSDVIFCRNLLIYLHEEARTRLLGLIRASLKPGGLLFVGHAEPLLCLGGRLRSIAAPHAFALEYGASSVEPEAPKRVSVKAERRVVFSAKTETTAPVAPVTVRVFLEPTVDDARDLADAGRASESEDLLRKIIARKGPTAETLELLGMLRMAANDTIAARSHFEQAVYLEPSRAASLLQLAMISERNGDARQAALLWERAHRASGSPSTARKADKP